MEGAALPMTGRFSSAKCAALALLIANAAPANGGGTVYPADSLMLFVAAWCAPCHAELRRLDEIEAAAGPKTVRVVAFDDDPRTEAMLRVVSPRLLWRPTKQMWVRIHEDLSPRTAGLPFSLATDEQGRPCGESRQGLDAARTRTLIAACERD